MEGITLKEMGGASAYSLQDMIAPADELIIDPMPNLYFTRDPFASVGTGVFLHRMRFPTRRRETIYADYIFRYHPDFEGLVTRYYDRDLHANIEGGDVLNLPAHLSRRDRGCGAKSLCRPQRQGPHRAGFRHSRLPRVHAP